ncbi:hypothetical protein J5491_00335 [Candidatus Saccharibacteria bacterium]|nr:hypothetical protein [Candidatus Saccharibacteria bacterium]
MKNMRKIGTLLLVAAIAMSVFMPTTVAFAAGTKAPAKYTDVTKKTVGKKTYEAINYLRKHHAFDGVFEGKEFKPHELIKRGELNKIFVNIWSKKIVKISKKDKAKKKNRVSDTYAINKMKAVGKKFGINKIKWETQNVWMTRGFAALLIKYFIDLSTILEPIR